MLRALLETKHLIEVLRLVYLIRLNFIFFLLLGLYLSDDAIAITFDLLIVVRNFLDYYLVIDRNFWLLIYGHGVIDFLIRHYFTSIHFL